MSFLRKVETQLQRRYVVHLRRDGDQARFPVEASPPNYTFVDSMMAMRGLGERPNSGFLEYTDGVNTPFSNFEG